MTIRREVLSQIRGHIEQSEVLFLSRKGRNKALNRLEEARKKYEEARKEVLGYELSTHYRVAVFGSARLERGTDEFGFVTELTKSLVKARDVDIVTGGGPGVMEAANLGLRQAVHEARNGNGRKHKHRARNLGETIELPFEQNSNGHLDYERRHPEFSTRLQSFLDRTHSAYNAKGGIGTLFEMLMLAQAGQVGHLEKTYPILADPFWKPVVEAWNDAMYHSRVSKGLKPLIGESDLRVITFSSDIEEVTSIIAKDHDRWRNNVRRHVRIIP